MSKRQSRRQRGRDRATRPITSSERGKRIRSLLDSLPLGAMVTRGMLDRAIAGLLIPTETAARAIERLGVRIEARYQRLEAELRDDVPRLTAPVAGHYSVRADLSIHPWHATYRPQACQGCQHYLGTLLSGEKGSNWLCCAMHPYGPDGEKCPDWERGN